MASKDMELHRTLLAIADSNSDLREDEREAIRKAANAVVDVAVDEAILENCQAYIATIARLQKELDTANEDLAYNQGRVRNLLQVCDDHGDEIARLRKELNRLHGY